MLPSPSLEITFDKNLDFRVTIDVRSLKKWNNWKKSKSYLETLGDSFCLKGLANDHFILIKNFYLWLIERQHCLHKTDLAKLQTMEEHCFSLTKTR